MPNLEKSEQFPKELSKGGKEKIELKLKTKRAEISAEVVPTDIQDKTESKEIELEEGDYLTWAEENLKKEKTPLGTEKIKILKKIKISKKISAEEKNKLLDELMMASTQEEVKKLNTSL